MRFNLVTPNEINIRESRGIVKDIHDPVERVREPLSAYRVMLDLIRNEPTLAAAYDIIVEFATSRGYDFTGGTKEKREELRNLFYDTLNFNEVLPNIIYSLFYYGDCFLELRKRNSTTPNELWVLETTEMRIVYDENGLVIGYVQRPFNMGGMTDQEVLEEEKKIMPDGSTQGIFFEEKEVIHLRMKWIGSQVYSYNPNEPISVAASTSLYCGNYLMNIFINMPPRYVAHLAGVSRSEHLAAKKEFQSAKTNYKKTIAFTRSNDPQSKLTMQKIEPPYDKTLIEIKKYINTEILKITRVPRTWVESENSENRGVGESLNLPFETRIHFLHRNILEPKLNRKLMRALGFSKKPAKGKSKLRFRFNEVSRKGEKEILEAVKLLKEMGLKHDAVVKYIEERGILGLDETDFEDLEAKSAELAKDKDSFPSRARMNKATDDMTQNRNEAGVSDKSGKKMGIA